MQQDDFAWLGLRERIRSLPDLLRALFEPLAQGTVRPVSERLFFIVYSGLFGTWAFPYRLTAFLVQTLNLLLLNAVGRRLTGSAAAGCCAALLWTANSALAVPMSWSSAFNQILCACCIFGAFYFLLRFETNGRKRDWRIQWGLYLFGFGALELNVVYPALATAYAALCAPPLRRRTLPLWLPALVYADAASNLRRLEPRGGRMRSTSALLRWPTFCSISGAALSARRNSVRVFELEPWVRPRRDRPADRAALIGFAWGVVPRRPQERAVSARLVRHSDRPVPATRQPPDGLLPVFWPPPGFPLLAGWGLQTALNRNARTAAAAGALVCLYLVSALPIGRAQMFYYYARGQRVKPLVAGVVETRRLHPDKTIYLAGVDEPLFWGAVYDRPFRLWNVRDVYLLPDAGDGGGERYRLGEARFERAPQEAEEAIVLRLDGARLEAVAND